ncbi:putative potassium channel protein 2 [Diplonema papillatum]|nr:putative potassium channel protein 2 [Diplonema papillatum]
MPPLLRAAPILCAAGLCLLAAGAPLADPRSDGDPAAAMHFWDARCNPLAYRDWAYLNQGKGELQDVPFEDLTGAAYRAPPQPRADALNSIMTRVLAAAPFGAAWLANDGDLWVTTFEDFHHLFWDANILRGEYGDAWYKFATFEEWSFYKRTRIEYTVPYRHNLVEAADLSAGENMLVYTHRLGANGTSECVARTLEVFDIENKAKVHLDLTPSQGSCAGGAAEPSVYFLAPHVSGDWLLATEWDAAARRGRLHLFDLRTGAKQLVAHASQVAVHARVWNTTDSAFVKHDDGGDDGGDAADAIVAFLRYDDPRFAGDQPADPDLIPTLASVGDSFDLVLSDAAVRLASIVFVYLPSRREVAVPPEEWRAKIRPFETITGLAGGGLWLFVGVRGAGGSSFAVVAIKATDPAEFFVIPESISPSPIHLVSAFSQGCIVTVASGSLPPVYWIIRVYTDHRGVSRTLVCKAFSSSIDDLIGSVAFLYDVCVYQKKQSGADPVGMFFADFDKDNDRYWDKVDRFPLRSNFVNDTDNDGIGDAADIVPAHGSCTEKLEFHPNTCTNDLVVLYSVWGGFTAVLFISVMLFGRYWKRNRERLYTKKKATSDEWVNRQWRETTRHDLTEEELFELMAELDDRIQKARGLGAEMVAQSILFALTILSVGLWVASMWSRRGLSQRVEQIVAWIDLFTTTTFFLDLLYRWVYRDDGEYTGFRDYCLKNWYDFPSLICDIPGLTTAGTLNVLVVARLIRVLRIFKMFRVVRLYHRVTQQDQILGLILRYDTVWQAVFVCGLIITLGVIIKIVEQEEQEVFVPYWNVLWFCIVTVTTIGYGDMVPKNWISRVIAVFLMVSGIGIIGVLTASMGESVRLGGIDKQLMMERFRKMQAGKWQLSLEYLRNSVLYNPVLSIFKPYQRGTCAHVACTRGRNLCTNDRVIKLSYEDHKFHARCFRCAGCGKGVPGLALSGACWVVPSLVSKATEQWKTSLWPARSKADDARPKYRTCSAAIFLHKRCLRKVRGDKMSDSEEESEQDSVRTSETEEDVRQLYIGKEEVIVEEIIVSGLQREAAAMNGTYIRRPLLRSDNPVLFDHASSTSAKVTQEDGKWKLLNNIGPVEVCYGHSEHLLGKWQPGEDAPPKCGVPIVEDAGAQLHYWHRLYDSLDVPVRDLIINYASRRTKAQFNNLLDSMRDLGADDHAQPRSGGGKFGGVFDRKKNLDRDAQMERARVQIKVVSELEERRTVLRLPCSASDKLTLILRTHIKDPERVKHYDLLKDHLEYLIFEKNAGHPHGTCIGRAFALATATDDENGPIAEGGSTEEGTYWEGGAGDWNEEDYDWSDPVEWTLSELDKRLVDHDVIKLDCYNAIKTELEHLILSYDRVLMCTWAWEHLTWHRWEERAERPLRQQFKIAEMPNIPRDRYQYSDEPEDLFDPLTDDLERHQLETGKEMAASSLIRTSAIGHDRTPLMRGTSQASSTRWSLGPHSRAGSWDTMRP